MSRGYRTGTVTFTLSGRLCEELVDWKNWRGRVAVFVDGRKRPRGVGTQTTVTMRTDDLDDMVGYLDNLCDAVASLERGQRAGCNMVPVRAAVDRLRWLLEDD